MPDNGSYGLDEYIVLVAFLCGMLIHSLLVVRAPRRIGGALATFGASIVAAWFLADPGPERRMETLFFTAMFYAVAFAIAFRAQVMPVVTVAGLVHYTMLFYYAVSLSARAAGVDLPASIVLVGSLPAVFVLALVVWGRRAGSGIKKIAYAWFLLVLTALVIQEVSLMVEHGPRRGEAPLAEAAVWFFFLGPLWLYFVSNIVYLIMMMPALRGSETHVWRAILGEQDDAARHREEAARRVTGLSIGPSRLVLILLHGTLLTLNWTYGIIPHGVAISASVIALVHLENR